MHWQHHRSDWAIIQSHAPHFTSVLEALNERKFNSPDPIDDLPECLNLKSKNTFDSDQEWQQYLDSDVGNGVTTREIYLRVLLAYAVSDQGADIPGVRLFMNHFIKECYSNGVRLFETRPRMGDPVMIRIAFEGANLAFKKRSDIWGREGKRNASTYSVFTVDGIPGKPSANWYVNSRIAPALSIAHQVEGGLTEILSNHANPQFQKSWETVKKTIRQDAVHGLFQAIGDKAIHLYMKWVYGTFKLIPTDVAIPPDELPIPMDQRIGKVLMRSGFMDEFYGMEESIQSGKFLFTRPGGTPANLDSGSPRDDRTFLRVTNFRNYGEISDDEILRLLKVHYPNTRIRSIKPQTALVCLLKMMQYNRENSLEVHELDDAMMGVANHCHDRNPDCASCPISDKCQANNAVGKSYLKKYYT